MHVQSIHEDDSANGQKQRGGRGCLLSHSASRSPARSVLPETHSVSEGPLPAPPATIRFSTKRPESGDLGAPGTRGHDLCQAPAPMNPVHRPAGPGQRQQRAEVPPRLEHIQPWELGILGAVSLGDSTEVQPYQVRPENPVAPALRRAKGRARGSPTPPRLCPDPPALDPPQPTPWAHPSPNLPQPSPSLQATGPRPTCANNGQRAADPRPMRELRTAGWGGGLFG